MKTLKAFFANSKTRAVTAVGAVTAVASNAASAAYTMPPAATQAFTDMLSAWEAIESYLWPVVAAVIIGMFVIRKAKQGGNKL